MAWVDFSGTQDSCYEMVDERTRNAGFKGQRSGETFFFWFGTMSSPRAASVKRTSFHLPPTTATTTLQPAGCRIGS
jgi:hypothetical protein